MSNILHAICGNYAKENKFIFIKKTETKMHILFVRRERKENL